MFQKFKNLSLNLSPVDLVFVSFTIYMTILSIVFSGQIWNWYILIPLNILGIITIYTLAWLDKNSGLTLWKQIHLWYLVPGVMLTFKEIYYLVKPIRQVDIDHILISIDRFIFGTDPTHWLYQFSHPVLTELLQISYATFFFLPIILAVNLMIKDRYEDMEFATFVIVLGFILSYFGYFLFPAVGPRFTLHEFDLTNLELPGLYFTNFLREVVNSGESIPAGTENPLAIVQRDVFPSGHTQMTLLVMYLAAKFRSRSKWFFLVNGTLLIFSTVYLRYHYVIDVIGGIIFMIITVIISAPLYNKWMKITGRKIFSYEKD